MQTLVTVYGQNDEIIGTVHFLGFNGAGDEIWQSEEFTGSQLAFLVKVCKRADYYWKERQTVTLTENEENEFNSLT